MVLDVRRYLLAYGVFYVKVFASGIILMIIGTTTLYIGIYYLGETVILPLDKFLGPLPPPHSKYVLEYPIIHQLSVSRDASAYVDTLSFRMPGYLVIRVYGEELVLAEVTITNRKTYESYSMIVTNNPLISNQPFYTVPVQGPGEYDVYIRDVGSDARRITLRIDKYVLSEELDAIIAKWLQGLGLAIFIVGVSIAIASPYIASKQAEALYLVPERIREELASMGIFRKHRSEEREEKS